MPADARRVSRLAVEEEANRPSFDLKDKRDFSGCSRQEGGYSGSSRWLIRLRQVAHLDRQPVPGGGEGLNQVLRSSEQLLSNKLVSLFARSLESQVEVVEFDLEALLRVYTYMNLRILIKERSI